MSCARMRVFIPIYASLLPLKTILFEFTVDNANNNVAFFCSHAPHIRFILPFVLLQTDALRTAVVFLCFLIYPFGIRNPLQNNKVYLFTKI